MSADSEVMVKVEGVGKKFCRDLKKSLWYGMKDIAAELLPGSAMAGGRSNLRPEEFWAVDDVSFALSRGECLGLIGPNGAGKTTLLKMLNGLIKPDKGRIEICGKVGALIALGAGFNPILTGRENIYVNATILGLSKQEIEEKLDEIVAFSELADFIDSPVQSYSSGMQVRLGFAVATALKPDVLILDEVLAVGDAAFRVKSFNRIQEILKTAAVIFVSHSLPQVSRICDNLLLMHHGRAVMHDSNIGNVITRFNTLLNNDDKPVIQGNGKSIIHSVLIEDEQRKATKELTFGAPFNIVTNVSIMDASVCNDMKILITIGNEEGNNVAQLLEHLPAIEAKTNFSVQIAFDKAPFNAGKYSLTVSLQAGKSGEMVSVMRNAASFVVSNSYSGYAPILLSPKFVVFCPEKDAAYPGDHELQ